MDLVLVFHGVSNNFLRLTRFSAIYSTEARKAHQKRRATVIHQGRPPIFLATVDGGVCYLKNKST